MEHPFLRSEMLWGPAAQRRLSQCHVILFGLGGVGSYAAECLARSGVGELTIVDSDTVALTNLNRQLEALHSTLGQPKAEAVAARLRDINPDLRLHPIHGLYDAVHRDTFFPEGCRYDYIADAIDLVSCKLDLAETALRLGIPPDHGAGHRQQAGPHPPAGDGHLQDLRLSAGPGHAQGAALPGDPPSEGGVLPGGARHPCPAGDAPARPPQRTGQHPLGARRRRTAAGQRRGPGPDRRDRGALNRSLQKQRTAEAVRCFMRPAPPGHAFMFRRRG